MRVDPGRRSDSNNPSGTDAATGEWKGSRLDVAFGCFALMLYAGAMITPLRVLRGVGPQQLGESEPVMAAGQFLILCVLVCVVTKRWRRILPLLRFITPYFLIVSLCIASSLWSEYPLSTLRRSITLGVCIMFGVYCYEAFGLSRLIHMVSGVAMFLGVLSLIVYFVAPKIGQEPNVDIYGTAMRGVFSQKNGMAGFMLLGIVCVSYRAIDQRRLTTFVLSALLLYVCIALGRSVSALLIATVILVLTGWLLLREKPHACAMFTFIGSSVTAVLIAGLILMPDEMLQLLGRDASLTGRLPLWRQVIATIADRPLLGYGYSGFWNAGSLDVQYLWQRAGWMAPDSHNGYLDVMLQTGVLGILLYVWLWTRIIRLALKAWYSGTLPVAIWVLLLMLTNVLVNLDEGPLPWADDFTAVGVSALISVEVWNQRRQRDIAVAWSQRAIFSFDRTRMKGNVGPDGGYVPGTATPFATMPDTGPRGSDYGC